MSFHNPLAALQLVSTQAARIIEEQNRREVAEQNANLVSQENQHLTEENQRLNERIQTIAAQNLILREQAVQNEETRHTLEREVLSQRQRAERAEFQLALTREKQQLRMQIYILEDELATLAAGVFDKSLKFSRQTGSMPVTGSTVLFGPIVGVASGIASFLFFGEEQYQKEKVKASAREIEIIRDRNALQQRLQEVRTLLNGLALN